MLSSQQFLTQNIRIRSTHEVNQNHVFLIDRHANKEHVKKQTNKTSQNLICNIHRNLCQEIIFIR